MSPATIDRLLHPWRRLGGRRPFTITKPGSLLKSSIPILTFADWQEDRPGFLEVDLVSHCGDSSEGIYLTTLSTVDVASGWSECVRVWGKGQELAATCHGLNPVLLLSEINENLEHLWKLAERLAYQQRRVKTYKASVT